MSRENASILTKEIARLVARVKSLESRVDRIEREDDVPDLVDLAVERSLAQSKAGSEPQSGNRSPEGAVLTQVSSLEGRLKQVEAENRELSELCNELREQNAAISNLYVAKHRLHASLDAAEIMKIITEILVELVGAEEFAILLLEPKSELLRRVAGRGASAVSEAVSLKDPVLGRVATVGKPFYYEPDGGQKNPRVPLAVVPLTVEAKTIGLIVIYRLLRHKQRFTPVDHRLLALVAENAPAALKSARLHRLDRSSKQKA